MFIVYVKHYLTPQGNTYFVSHWFPKVKGLMCLQNGYISVNHMQSKDANDCVNIAVVFKNEEALQEWAKKPEHGDLINELDNYRSRSYWEFANAITDIQDFEVLQWEKVEIPTHG